MDGYSKTPLVKKLGIKPGDRLLILNEPENHGNLIGNWPEEISHFSMEEANEMDFIHFFTQEMAELEITFPLLKNILRKGGGLWISWSKGKSTLPKDLNGNDVRSVGLAHGLVDVKVCSVDENWSGLKFMYRIKDR